MNLAPWHYAFHHAVLGTLCAWLCISLWHEEGTFCVLFSL